MTYRLRLIFPYGCIQPGQDWKAIGKAIESWITTDASKLSDGIHTVRLQGPWGKSRTELTLKFRADKLSSGIPDLILTRFDDTDFGLPGRIKSILNCLPQNVKQAVDRKSSKLRQYRGRLTTVLLLESDDDSLMNMSILADAIVDQYSGLPPDIDQIWFADTSLPWDVEFHDLVPLIQYRVTQPS
jgi:hypothetical protein